MHEINLSYYKSALLVVKALSKSWTWTGKLDLRKNVLVLKTGPQGLKTLPFV